MKKLFYMIFTLLVLTLTAVAPSQSAEEHFDPKGKLPSQHTIESQKQQRKGLPFADDRDFEEQKRGFIAAPDYKQIMAEAGNVAWDTAGG